MDRDQLRQGAVEVWRTARSMRRAWWLLVPLVGLWLVLFDVISILSVWPDWQELARGAVPKSRFIADYEQRRGQRRGQQRGLPRLRWTPVPLSSLPDHVARAFIVAEDSRFYTHDGVDLEALGEAIEYNVERGRLAVGASTISQQTAKNLFLTPERSFLRKWHELLLTWRMESELSKGRILAIYLNIVEFGRGLYGVEAAAQRYYGKPAAALNVAEAAALAATLPSPIKHNPASRTKSFKRRHNKLLSRLRHVGRVAVPKDRPEAPAEPPADDAAVGASEPAQEPVPTASETPSLAPTPATPVGD